MRTIDGPIDPDWIIHPVFVTDDGIIPICDICGGPQRVEGDYWNGDTGNHYSCEEQQKLIVDAVKADGNLDYHSGESYD